MRSRRNQSAFTLVELLVAVVLAALLVAAMSGLVSSALATGSAANERNELMRQGRFAMQRMADAVAATDHLFLPQVDQSATDWRENVREETVPASAPEGSSTSASAVLAVALGFTVDLDANGFVDADNDGDGRINEDPPADIAFDYADGIYLVDDGGNGSVDEGTSSNDDDEQSNLADEDPVNGLDDDGDGAIDEDPGADWNGDGAPGIRGVDDDGDGQIDEGDVADDDEDGFIDEDWIDVVVFYLQGDSLIERHPVPWDEVVNGVVDGRDVRENVIAERVTQFRIERYAASVGNAQLVDLTLELTGTSGETVSLSSRVRVGSVQ